MYLRRECKLGSAGSDQKLADHREKAQAIADAGADSSQEECGKNNGLKFTLVKNTQARKRHGIG